MADDKPSVCQLAEDADALHESLATVARRLIVRCERLAEMLDGPDRAMGGELVKRELMELSHDTAALCAVVFGTSKLR